MMKLCAPSGVIHLDAKNSAWTHPEGTRVLRDEGPYDLVPAFDRVCFIDAFR